MKVKLKHNNSQIAKIFSNTFRYIDDLLKLNNPTFEQEVSNIPATIRTKKDHARIGDLPRQFLTNEMALVVNFPHTDSNMPSKAEFLYDKLITSKAKDFCILN